MSQLTIKDIALRANVSRTTVSRVLNNSKDVSENTRQRVLAIIDEEQYTPSATAVSLSKRQSTIIGVIVPALENAFFGEMLRAFNDTFEDTEFVMMCTSTGDSFKKDMKSLEILRNYRVRGLIYTPAVDYREKNQQEQLKQQLALMDCSVVLIDRKLGGFNLSGIYFDDTAAVYEATEALILAGHTKVALLNGMKDRYLSRVRQEGYERAMTDHNLTINPDYILYGDYNFRVAYEKSGQLLAYKTRPTAVITCNNTTSLAFITALEDRGEAYPKDIIFIGLDNIPPLDVMDKNFNYIERDAYKMGVKAANMLLKKIEEPKAQLEEIFMKPRVVIRNIRIGG